MPLRTTASGARTSERDLSLEPPDCTDQSVMLPLTYWFLCQILTTLTIWKYLAYLGSLETVIARKSGQNVWNYQKNYTDFWLFCLYKHCTIMCKEFKQKKTNVLTWFFWLWSCNGLNNKNKLNMKLTNRYIKLIIYYFCLHPCMLLL